MKSGRHEKHLNKLKENTDKQLDEIRKVLPDVKKNFIEGVKMLKIYSPM
jgi:ClpP class serine protease